MTAAHRRRVFVALVVSAVVSAATAWGDPPWTGSLAVRLTRVRSTAGRVGCALYAGARGFPTDSTASMERVWCPIVGTEAVCTFAPMSAGTYAVACIHDENANGRLDTGLFGIPREGTVVSNEATGFMSAPSFADARFAFGPTSRSLTLRMHY